MSLMRSFQVASTALSSQSLRLNALASNLANAESVSGPDGKPYKPRQVVFRPAPILGEVAAGVEGGGRGGGLQGGTGRLGGGRQQS